MRLLFFFENIPDIGPLITYWELFENVTGISLFSAQRFYRCISMICPIYTLV